MDIHQDCRGSSHRGPTVVASVMGQVGDSVGDKVEDKVGGKVGSKVGGKVEDRVGEEVEGKRKWVGERRERGEER